MTIEIHCPNGHRLTCPDERAGKNGKCPTCGEHFTIPGVNGQSEDEQLDENTEQAADEKTSVAESSIGSGPGKQVMGQIVFLCPKGHKLNGPASLQGKPGKCPHCGIMFRIPVYGEEQKTEITETDKEDSAGDKDFLKLNLAEDITAGKSESGEIDSLDEITVAPRESESVDALPMIDTSLDDEPEYSDEDSYLDDLSDETHPLARLFMTLWREREHGGVVEIHLGDRESLQPDWWARGLSLETHGVFAMQKPDGSYTIETVAWDAIKRITIKKIAELPDGVFA